MQVSTQGNMAFNALTVLLLLLLAGTAKGARIGASAGAGKVSVVTALLSELYVSVGTLDPEFDPAEFTYTVSLNSSVSEIEVYVEAPPDQVSAGSGLSVNGTWVDSGEYSPSITLRDAGRTTTISIYVLAIGYSPASYTVYVEREAEKSGGGGLSWWIILLIVIAVLVVLALLGYLIYWAFQQGYFDWIPGVAERRTGGGSEYQPISH